MYKTGPFYVSVKQLRDESRENDLIINPIYHERMDLY